MVVQRVDGEDGDTTGLPCMCKEVRVGESSNMLLESNVIRAYEDSVAGRIVAQHVCGDRGVVYVKGDHLTRIEVVQRDKHHGITERNQTHRSHKCWG